MVKLLTYANERRKKKQNNTNKPYNSLKKNQIISNTSR